MANDGSGNFHNLEGSVHSSTSCPGPGFQSSEFLIINSADQIQVAIPVKVANEFHCIKRQIEDMGNTVTYSLHLTHRVLNLVVEYISHRHQVQGKANTDSEYEAEWEKNFIKSTVCCSNQLLAEFLIAAENLREKSLEARDYASILIRMADLIYLYGPSETIANIIESQSPFSTLSRLQTAFNMLSARISF